VIALAASVFVAALLGSVHCAGMCGGLACFVAGADGGARASAAYNGGRLAAYVALGALAGAAGAGFDRAGALAGWSRPAAIVAGILMIAWGTVTALQALGVRVRTTATPAGARNAITRSLRALGGRSPVQRSLALGVLTPLLPCGWLYAFVATAAATGSPGHGALLMAAFWGGTVPIMAALGLGLQRAFGPLRARLPAATAIALVVIGLLTVSGKFTPTAAHTAGAMSHEHEPR
jgi:sulfite exporter TauE/SafE